MVDRVNMLESKTHEMMIYTHKKGFTNGPGKKTCQDAPIYQMSGHIYIYYILFVCIYNVGRLLKIWN